MFFSMVQTLPARGACPALCPVLPATHAAPALTPAGPGWPSIAGLGFRRGLWAALQICEISSSHARSPLPGQRSARRRLRGRPVSRLLLALCSHHRRRFLATFGHTVPRRPAGRREDVVTPPAAPSRCMK